MGKTQSRHPPGRKRRIYGRTLLVLGLLVAGLWLLSWWRAYLFLAGPIHLDVDQGTVGFSVWKNNAPTHLYTFAHPMKVEWGEWDLGFDRLVAHFVLKAPLWVLSAVLLVAAALCLRSNRVSAARCPQCGYDKRGLPPGAVCPECGKA